MLLIIFILAVMIGVSDSGSSRKDRRRRGPIGGFRKPTITYMMRG